MAPPSVPPLGSSRSTPTPDSLTSKRPMTRVRQPEHEKAFACDCGKRFAYKTSIYHHKNRGGCPGRPWVTSEGGHRNRAKTGKHLSMSRAHELAQKMGEIGTLNVDFDNVPDHLKAEFYKNESFAKSNSTNRRKSSLTNASDSSPSGAPSTSQDDIVSRQSVRQRPNIGLRIREWKEPHPRQIGRPTLARQQFEQELHSNKPSLSIQHPPVVTPPTNQITNPMSQSPRSQGIPQSSLPIHPSLQVAQSAPSSTGNVDGQSNAFASPQQALVTDVPLNKQEDWNGMNNINNMDNMDNITRQTSTPPSNKPSYPPHSFNRNNSHLAPSNSHSRPSVGSATSSHASIEQDDGGDSDAYVLGDVDDEACVSRTRWGPAGVELAQELARQRFSCECAILA